MTLQTIQEKYIGKRLNLYLIDGEEVSLSKTGSLTFQFKAEIFDDEALNLTNSLCSASLKLSEDHTVLDVEPLSCQRELEITEDDFLLIDCTPTEEDYVALHYALMCAVIRPGH
jgi:hypothetical protein